MDCIHVCIVLLFGFANEGLWKQPSMSPAGPLLADATDPWKAGVAAEAAAECCLVRICKMVLPFPGLSSCVFPWGQLCGLTGRRKQPGGLYFSRFGDWQLYVGPLAVIKFAGAEVLLQRILVPFLRTPWCNTMTRGQFTKQGLLWCGQRGLPSATVLLTA